MRNATNNNAAFEHHIDLVTARDRRLRPLWLMTPAERLATFHRGDMTAEQMYSWAARYPREVPLVNGEFAFIAASAPESGVPCPVCGDNEVLLADGVLTAHPDHRHPFDPTDPYADRPTCDASLLTPADARDRSATRRPPAVRHRRTQKLPQHAR